jgi:hypothetical protein
MRLLVYIRDGRTCYRLTGRKNLMRLLQTEPWHEEPGITVERGIWNPETGLYVWTFAKVRYIAKGSIGVIEEDAPVAAVA